MSRTFFKFLKVNEITNMKSNTNFSSQSLLHVHMNIFRMTLFPRFFSGATFSINTVKKNFGKKRSRNIRLHKQSPI